MAYRDVIISTPDLSAYWPMDQGMNSSNMLLDTVSGRQLNIAASIGTGSSTPILPVTYPDGTVNYGPSYLTRANSGSWSSVTSFPAILTNNSFTMEMVAKQFTPYAGNYGAQMRLEMSNNRMFSQGTVSDNDATVAERGRWSAARYNGSTYTTNLRGVTRVDNDGAWHHLVFTYDGTNARLYVDGTLEKSLVDSAASGAPTGETATLYIAGKQVVGNYVPSGSYGHPALYSRALTSTEVAAHSAEFFKKPSGQAWPR